MTDHEFIQSLLEQMMETGETAEAVGAATPHLIPELRAQWARLGALSREIDALFPTGVAVRRQPASSTTLPSIPGYDSISFLGRGGMGVVYKARHIALGRVVAIKMLLPGFQTDDAETEALLREASAVAALNHPNIVHVYEVGALDGRPYFTMEYLEGGSLAQRTDRGPCPPRHAAELVVTLATAIQVAHDGGIVHRDLKPGNILFTLDNTPKIADFSLARRIAIDPSITLGAPGFGTPSYMAPEQALSGPSRCHPAVDIYALGAVLYDLLTGRPPFQADSPVETHRQVIEEEPAAPSRINARIPRDLETICLACLRKDPERRYASAAALADDLRRFLDGRPVTARRAGPVERAFKWAIRHPAPVAFVSIAAIVLISIVVWGVMEESRRSALASAASADLDRIALLEVDAQWDQARALLSLVRTRLGPTGTASLSARVNDVEREIDLGTRLDTIRTQRALSTDPKFDIATFDERCRTLLQEAGVLGTDSQPAPDLAARIKESRIRPAIIRVLNDWTLCSTQRAEVAHKLEIARLADPDPAWRDRVRDMNTWTDREALRKLAENAPTDPFSADLAPILAAMLEQNGIDPVTYLRRVQAGNPADFWANFRLAEYLDQRSNPESVGFYRAARALRPDSVAAQVNLGIALLHQGEFDQAQECWRAALQMDSACSMAHINLACAAINEYRFDDAITHARRVVELNEHVALAWLVLGDALGHVGVWDESIRALDRAEHLFPPNDPQARTAIARRASITQLRTIEADIDRYLDGTLQPADDAECADIASLLRARGRPLDAVRMFQRWTSAHSGIASDSDTLRVVEAACAACESSTTPGRLPDQSAADRRLAVNWLRDLMDAISRTVEANPDFPRRTARHRLDLWKRNPGLRPIRNPEALDRLPATEANDLRQFWKDVDALSARLSTPTVTR